MADNGGHPAIPVPSGPPARARRVLLNAKAPAVRLLSTRSLVVPVLAGALLLAGCTGDPIGGEEGGAVADLSEIDVAATVNGIEISGEEVAALVEARGALLADVAEEDLDEQRAQLVREVLGQQIQLTAVEAAVEERFDVKVEDVISDAEIEAAIDDNIEAMGGEEAFAAAADEQGIDVETARTFSAEEAYIFLLVTYVQDTLAAENDVTSETLEAQYDDDPTAFQSSDVSHILVETEAEALDVLARIEAGEEFAALATELSTDPGSGANGGSLGVQPRGTYVPEFSEAVYAEDTVIGEVVGPVKSEFGYHLIVVNELITAPFADVESTMRQSAIGDEYGAFIDGVFDGMVVEVNEALGSWNAETLTIEAPAGEDESPEVEVEAPSVAPSESSSEG